jgi:hypothetical protein
MFLTRRLDAPAADDEAFCSGSRRASCSRSPGAMSSSALPKGRCDVPFRAATTPVGAGTPASSEQHVDETGRRHQRAGLPLSPCATLAFAWSRNLHPPAVSRGTSSRQRRVLVEQLTCSWWVRRALGLPERSASRRRSLFPRLRRGWGRSLSRALHDRRFPLGALRRAAERPAPSVVLGAPPDVTFTRPGDASFRIRLREPWCGPPVPPCAKPSPE